MSNRKPAFACVFVLQLYPGVEGVHGQPAGQLQGQRRQKHQVTSLCVGAVGF